jgi:GH25 family lysozyme M1 (1,4-beta-N-acetylmuramidase)
MDAASRAGTSAANEAANFSRSRNRKPSAYSRCAPIESRRELQRPNPQAVAARLNVGAATLIVLGLARTTPS